MEEAKVVHSTFVIERAYPKPPERVFQAFSDPAQKRRWFAEGLSHEVTQYELAFEVGGLERVSYRFKPGTPFPGVELNNTSIFLEITPAQRIVFAQGMDFAGKRISATLVTIELLRSNAGTNLVCTHQGAFFEGSDGPEMRKDGWRKLFESLAGAIE